jgi:hypothetical protein
VGHYPADPSRGPLRHVPSYRTTERGWAAGAIDALLDYRDVIVNGVFVSAHGMHPRVPVWAQLRRRLAAAGVRVPVDPPDDDPPWAPGATGTLGATGCGG